MLWENIYDFFVTHIFGGITSSGVEVSNSLFVWDSGAYRLEYIEHFKALDITLINGSKCMIDYGSYFSLIATIISMVAIVLFCVFIIKKIIGIIFRLFTGSSAF